MKVFEVLTEYLANDSDEIRTERQYVTAEKDDFRLITEYFVKHCYEYEKTLLGIREVLTIVQHIKNPEE